LYLDIFKENHLTCVVQIQNRKLLESDKMKLMIFIWTRPMF